jgi:putative ABC transport system ATP-binding protein
MKQTVTNNIQPNKLEEQINHLSEQIFNTPITNQQIYKVAKQQTVKLISLIKEFNAIKAKTSQITDNKEIPTENDGTPTKLYNHILELESRSNLQYPSNKIGVHKLNRIYKKYYTLQLRQNYYINCLIPNNKHDQKQKLVLNKQLDLIKKQVQISHDDIQTVLSSAGSRYLAKQVNRLDRMKKQPIGKADSSYAIDLEGTVKYYSNGALAVKVLKGIDLKIEYGEFVVILGPSGSGKTTLLNIISGMDKATYGRTVVAGVDLINKNSTQLTQFRKDNLGYIFQQYGLLPNLTVRENVEIGANLQRDKTKRMDIDELLKQIGIFEFASKFPHELSGGQQQRVSIARSMAKNPSLIFGDEPTGAIDEEMSKHIMQLFVDINKKFKTTIIIVTHNPILAGLATTVIKVNNGKIAAIIKNKHPKQVNELE